MLHLYFGNLFSILTTVLVLGMLAYAAVAIKNRRRISKWGKLILLFIVAGTAISAFSAMRDGYAGENAVFAMNSIQAMVCSLAGGAIFLTGLVTLFLKKQSLRKGCFYIITALFLVQVLTIEISRMILL